MTPRALSGLDLLATAVVLVDAKLAVRYMNPAAENLFEVSSNNMAGLRPEQAVPRQRRAERRHRLRPRQQLELHRARLRGTAERAFPAARLVHGDAARSAGWRAAGGNDAARVPPHRAADQDRARGAHAEPDPGQSRADPQSRARDQESARRNSRRGAAARPRARAPQPARVHAGHHEGGRPAAVADGPPADAAPAAAGRAAQRARGAGARAQPDHRGVSAGHRDRRATTTSACRS